MNECIDYFIIAFNEQQSGITNKECSGWILCYLEIFCFESFGKVTLK